MITKVIDGKTRYIGYPESLCLTCEWKLEECSLEGTRDVEMCPDYKRVTGQTVLKV